MPSSKTLNIFNFINETKTHTLVGKYVWFIPYSDVLKARHCLKPRSQSLKIKIRIFSQKIILSSSAGRVVPLLVYIKTLINQLI